MRLPRLRDELSLHAGAVQPDGSPTWLIYDPHQARYFQIGWSLFEIIRRWDEHEGQRIIERVNDETTLFIGEADIAAAVKFLSGHELLRPSGEIDTKRFLTRSNASQQTFALWLIHNYLFFRVPLVRPDYFLTATLQYVRFVASKKFALLTLAVLVIGLILVVRDWSSVVAQLKATWSVEGLIGYSAAVIFAKLIHELGHAYVAKGYGCRVATMGLAFLILYPIPYTDTNDAWRVRSQRGRLAISSAGMVAELYMAAWATFLWSFLPEGSLKSAAMTLAVTTWMMSLVVNASPIMRFDGYYILSDLWETPNLHGRSFAFGRWFIRETLFAFGDPPPEAMARKRRNLFIVFAYVVWVYRLIVFLGIALLVYHFFIKLVGIILFCIEIGWFVVAPIARELSAWWRRRDAILQSTRTRLTWSVLGLITLLLVVPWSTHIEVPALLRAERMSQIFPPVGAVVVEVFVSEGAVKQKGEPLFELQSLHIDYQIQSNDARMALLQKQIRMAGFDDDARSQYQYLHEKLISAMAERQSLLEQKRQLLVVAPFNGQVFDILPDLRVGQSVGPRQKLASLREPQSTVAVGFVGDGQLHRIEVGQPAKFYPETTTLSSVQLKVTTVETFAVQSLEHPVLAAHFGGAIASLGTGKVLQPHASIYKVVAQPIDSVIESGLELRGTLQIHGRPESLVARVTRSALAVLVRESGM